MKGIENSADPVRSNCSYEQFDLGLHFLIRPKCLKILISTSNDEIQNLNILNTKEFKQNEKDNDNRQVKLHQMKGRKK